MTSRPKFVSIPSTIEATQYLWFSEDHHNHDQVLDFCTAEGEPKARISNDGAGPVFLKAGKDGAQGWVPVPAGHWIVRNPGDHSDYWPVDPDYFAAKYVPQIQKSY